MHLIDLISAYSIIVPVLAGALLFRRLHYEYKILCVYIIIGFCTEIAVYVLAHNHHNNHFLFHFYTYIEFSLFSYFYYRIFRSIRAKNWVLTSLFLFYVFSVINNIIGEGFSEFNSYQRTLENFIFISYVITYYSETIKSEKTFIEYQPSFIFSTGLLLFVIGTLLLYWFSNAMIKQYANTYWTLHGLFTIFFNGIITISLWKGRRIQTR